MEAELADGTILEFPDGTSPAVIQRVVKQRIGGAAPKRTLTQDVSGFMANVNRGSGVGDEIAGGLNTVGNILTGKVGLPQIPADFRKSMATQRQIEDEYNAAHPRLAGLARGMGMAPTMLIPGGTATAAPRALNMARGATVAGLSAAGMAAADRGTGAERLKAASSAATNPVVLGLGAGAGALAPALRLPQKVKAPVAPTAADTLKAHGITTSIPQRMGGLAKQVEDLSMRAPILGPAISGARSRQVEQLNRAVGLRALAPVGKSLPKDIKPGFEMVDHVDQALGDVYKQATDLVPRVSIDQPFADDLASIAERKADLPENVAKQFDSIMGNRLNRLQGEEATGAMVKKIHGELGALQGEAAKKGEETLSSMLGDVRRSIMGLIERADPKAGELVRQADQGWQVYSLMNDAAAQANNRGGVFLPGQLNTQVRSAGRRLGTNMTGKGRAPLQDLATAATQTIPDQFGNPGTANAIGLGALGTGALTAPGPTMGTAAGLSAAATPYWLMGRKVIEELPATASPAELAKADEVLAHLATADPAVDRLRQELSVRLSRAVGIAGGSRAPAVEVSVDGRPDLGVGRAYGPGGR